MNIKDLFEGYDYKLTDKRELDVNENLVQNEGY